MEGMFDNYGKFGMMSLLRRKDTMTLISIKSERRYPYE